MNKNKFELYLREKLSVLKQSEIDEIISEYLQHIHMKKAEGISEEEAISDFGDLDELVDEILDAYKIDTSKDQFEDFSNLVKNWLNKSLNYINEIASSLMKRSGKEMVLLIIEFVLVLFLLGIISFLIDMVANNFVSIFYFTPYFIMRIIRFFTRILNVILSLTISLSILYWFVSERILNKEVSENIYTKDVKPRVKPESKIVSDYPAESSVKVDDNNQIDLEDKDEDKKVVRPDVRENLEAQANKKSFGQVLFDGNLFVLKAIMFVILIPMIVGGVALGSVFVLVLYNTILGYGSIGLSFILSGVLLIYYYLLTLGVGFVSGGKSK